MFLEGLLNDGQYLSIHQSRGGLLYQALFLAQGCAYAEQIQRVDRSPGGLAGGRVGGSSHGTLLKENTKKEAPRSGRA
jgi:hypothetical protein